MKRALSFLLLLMIAIPLSSTNAQNRYNRLYIQNPQSWDGGPGSIKEATVAFEPNGSYMQYNLYLTFTAEHLTHLPDTAQLETILNFSLPDQAVINDLWLWVGEDIVRADIIDRWTASNIYEGIVNRRKDPAILYHNNWDDGYELRVYPIWKDTPRKVRISYLVPLRFSLNQTTSSLPVELLGTSDTDIEGGVNLVYKPANGFDVPRILEHSEVEFTQQGNGDDLDYRANLPFEAVNGNITLAFNSRLENGLSLHYYEKDENKGYYQLSVLPNRLVEFETGKNIIFLFEYRESKTTYTKEQVIGAFEQAIRGYLDPGQDKFNVVVSGLDNRRMSETWLTPDSSTVDSISQVIMDMNSSDYGNMPALLTNGIDYINANGGKGALLLMSSSDDLHERSSANSLIDDLMDKMETTIPVFVGDFANDNLRYNYIGGRSYAGNEYFYLNLARLTSGRYLHLRESDQYYDIIAKEQSGASDSEDEIQSSPSQRMMDNLVQSVNSFLSSFDLYTSMESGFTHSRYNVNGQAGNYYLDRPVIQVGQYNGSMPFEVELSGVFKDSAFTTSVTVPDSVTSEVDSTAQSIWAASYLQSISTDNPSNERIAEIINMSVENRVLSEYTAFLALEPSDTVDTCSDCEMEDDSDSSLPIEEEANQVPDADADTLYAYPNPFNSQVTIEATIPKHWDLENTKFAIYNILGQEVKTFEPKQHARSHTFRWHITRSVALASGVYLFKMYTGSEQRMIKLMYLK